MLAYAQVACVPMLCTVRNMTRTGQRANLVCEVVQNCKRHKPDGCFRELPNGESKLKCPFCLIFPIMCLLHKITNHLELLKGALLCRLSSLAFRSACASPQIYTAERPSPVAVTVALPSV